MDYTIKQAEYTVPKLKGYRVEHRDHNGYTRYAKGKHTDDCLAPKFWSLDRHEARLYEFHIAASIARCQCWCRTIAEYTQSRKKAGVK